ncbi:hypothetical protein TPY_0397 [Sulfobacillus acidophilus TPY]|uniref:3'-5' exonuclease, PolB n=1 Tax=Sulfobacillus acidophilus (strain ATCC 700253 / DSM 10332 / NAL) TaxID=679936 RepID=G8TY24_SULAD|nr:hypothetical protein TPY_0397 [Sulfobacillus acidophilus TPY]AEW03931.1 3'-5' exonuclease, PolB [Sulfobacillus acidophilus DSM 10332]
MSFWLVFDIETVPDAVAGRRWLGLAAEVDDRQVRRRMIERRREETGQASDFLKPGFHQVVAIAAALVDQYGVLRKINALGRVGDSEEQLIRDFFQVIHDLHPRLVGWNTSGFDLPTLIYRAIRHQIPAAGFYQVGEPYHGYRKRYDEESHLDLMDLLSGYGASSRLTLDEMAAVLGVPGKLEIDGGQVLELYEAGAIDAIRHYCLHDVLTTTLVFGAYAFHRGWWKPEQYREFQQSVRRFLRETDEDHWRPFREAWALAAGEAWG